MDFSWIPALADKIPYFAKLGITFGISLLPVVELRGAIPVGVALGLPHLLTFLIAYLGNMLPVPFIILFVRKIFDWMKRKSKRLGNWANRLEKKALKKSKQVKRYKVLGLLLFVAIPIPGTGAWTGSLIAALLNMRLKDALPTIALGVLIAGVLMTGLTLGFSFFLN